MEFERIKDSIQFIYIGKFYISTKKFYEKFILDTINNIIKLYDIKYFPSNIIIKFESKKYKTSSQYSFGGTWEKNILLLQAWNLPKHEFNNFFNLTIIHELFHLFVPIVFMSKSVENGCFTEGFVEFLTYKYNNNLEEGIKLYVKEYNNINNKLYKNHKFMYFYGLTYMNKLYQKDPEKIDILINNILFDRNKNKKSYYKTYYQEDIIKYDKRLKKLFSIKCNHIPHTLKE
jgi:hypothetical protein